MITQAVVSIAGLSIELISPAFSDHDELIGVRAALDHAALAPLPELPYLVCVRHLRRVSGTA